MDQNTDEFSYGKNGELINVYLPRADVNPLTGLAVPPPSPVFSLENVFKFSDQVLQDRHLFLSRKTYFHNDDDDNQSEREDKGDKSHRSNRSSSEDREDLSSVNVIKLTLDSSGIKAPSPKDKRFNERLSSYVTTKKKLQVPKNGENNGKLINPNELNLVNQLDKLVQTPRKIQSTPSVRRSKLRRGISFHFGSSTNKGKLELPQLGRSSPGISPRQKTNVSLKQDHTNLFPEAILSSKTSTQGHPRMPMRPSSKPHKIWRQSTDVLLGKHMPPIEFVKPLQPSLVSRKASTTLYRNKTLV